MKLIFKISFIIVFIFSLFGMFITGTLVHELSHKNDLKDIAIKGTDKVCILEFEKGEIGSYNFRYNQSDEEELNRISKYTEVKAYITNIITDTIYIFSLGLIILYFYEQKLKRKELKIMKTFKKQDEN